ncbi:hypothetical protein [Microbacterium candidum]|uniref:HK97 gp10 family phage protein n=1 Tax=Microbacterium candidum TaxID=3041922 RepID=A0ABT7MXJ1_9MICO|nr:hypothetical protein [Microbacterium sp. ASV49]MDL9979163.1 hypothetical protein [Microbacterium sp. ASV49]
MGLFSDLKDMRTMVQAAPGLIDQAGRLQAQAATYQQQMAVQPPMTAEPAPGALEPIAGVDLDRYARIVKGIAAYGYDESKLEIVAAGFGVDGASWAAAQAGWGERIRVDRGVGRRFNEIYAGV